MIEDNHLKHSIPITMTHQNQFAQQAISQQPQSTINPRPGGNTFQYEHEKSKSSKSVAGLPKGQLKRSKQNATVRAKKDPSCSKSSKYLEGNTQRSKGLAKQIFQPKSKTSYQRLLLTSLYDSSNHNNRKRRNTFNKEVFLQANCHFVVDGSAEKYQVHLLEPDILVDWDAIQLVYLKTLEVQCCPICLSPPSAAKMTRCGHVYCWSCILHYLTLSEKLWSKCPICHEAVQSEDLKSVHAYKLNKFAQHDNMTMRLIKRRKGTLRDFPVDEVSTEGFPEWNGDIVFGSKLMIAKKELITKCILNKEKTELEYQLLEATKDQTGEEPYIMAAFNELERKLLHTRIDEEHEVEEILSSITSDLKITDDLKMSSLNKQNKNGVIGCHGNEKDEEDKSEFYYYYQAEDGQNIFIDSLNARCLIEQYGSLSCAPQKVIGQIIDSESFSMTHELRKRFRYLSHLPLACEFVICELLLRPPYLAKQTIRNFMPEFQRRKQQRARKKEEQRKFDLRASNVRSKQLGFRVSVDDSNERSFDMMDFPCSISSASVQHEEQDGPSFAQILKREENQTKQTTVALQTHDSLLSFPTDDSEAPSFRDMFNAALFSPEQQHTANNIQDKTKKKKNNKRVVLFATNAQRKY